MNINLLANNAVTSITPNHQIEWYVYKNVDNTGEIPVVTYENPIILQVMVQSVNLQDIKFLDGYSQTKIYWNFWLNEPIQGLNWGAQRLQDYVIYNGLKYYVVKIVHVYNKWTNFVGCQSND